MNKRLFSIAITAVIVTFMSICANAADAVRKVYWNRSPYTFGESGIYAMPVTSMELEENEMWWGYFKGNFGTADPATWHYAGFYSECAYSCCIKLDADNKHGIGRGKTIEGIRFPFADIKNIDNVRVWISTELPSGKYSEGADVCYMNIDKSSVVDALSSDGINYINEIRFDKPYTITDEDVYVGYTFEVTNVEKFSDTPVVCTNNKEDYISLDDAFYMKMNKGQWQDQENYGEVLSMQVLFSGDFMNEAAEVNSSFGNIVGVKNNEYKVPLSFVNTGRNGIKSFSYKVTANGITTDEKTVTLDNEINYIGSSFEYELSATAPSQPDVYELAFEITKINGLPNMGNSIKSTGELISVSKRAERKVFVEDYTDVNNGYSPINFINAEKTKQIFGNDVVIVSVHGEDDDPMFCTDYNSYLNDNEVGDAPECVIDRSMFGLTPYDGTYVGDEMHFGFGDDIKKAQSYAPVAEIHADVKLSDDKMTLEATASTTFLFNGTKNNYALAYILKEDGMSNDDWIQLNDYYEYTGCGLEDEEPLYDKWVNGSAEMKGVVFNDVVIAGRGIEKGIDGSINGNIKDGEVQTHNISFNLSNYPIIQNTNNLSLCVMLIDRTTGKVVNADCIAVSGSKENATYTDLEIKDNELWWGLFKGDFGGSDPYDWHKVGYGSTITYGCCMKLHADNVYSMGKGKTVEGIRFAFPDIKNIDNVKVWMSSYLPEEASAEDADLCYMELDRNKLVDGVSCKDGGAYVNEVRFDKPYTVGDKDIYIGYTFDMLKIGDAYDQTPVVCYDKTDKILDYKDAFYLRWDDFKWQSQEFDKETLAIQMLMSGDFNDHDIMVEKSFNDMITEKNKDIEIPVKIMNLGRNGISTLSYSVSYNGNEINNSTLTLDSPITYIGDKVECRIPVNAGSDAVAYDINVNVTKINDIDTDGKNNSSCGQMIVVDKRADRKILLEDYTANWSGASPIGIINIERATANFGNTIVPVAIHLTNDDPMTYKEYTRDLNIKSVPTSILNRNGVELYPYFGSDESDEFKFGYGDDISREIQKLTIGEIEASAKLSEDKSTVTAVSRTTFNFTGEKSNYAIEYILTENGMHNDDWMQANTYTEFKGAGIEDYEPFFDRWINGEENMNIEFNNVIVAAKGGHNGMDNSVENSIKNGAVQENTVLFNLAEYPLIQNAENLTLCVLLIDRNTGEVMNVAMTAVGDGNLGIHDTDCDMNVEMSRFNIDGTRLQTPTRGINIIKYSDGTVKKVINN